MFGEGSRPIWSGGEIRGSLPWIVGSLWGPVWEQELGLEFGVEILCWVLSFSGPPESSRGLSQRTFPGKRNKMIVL